jgi:hypothetical protein
MNISCYTTLEDDRKVASVVQDEYKKFTKISDQVISLNSQGNMMKQKNWNWKWP